MYDMIDELDKNLITFKRDVIRQLNINHRRINVVHTKLMHQNYIFLFKT